MPDIVVRTGEVLALRLFDIAYATDLARAESLWTAHVGSKSERSRLVSAPAKALAFGVPPLLLTLPTTSLAVGTGIPVVAHVTARLYDFGVVALTLRTPVTDITWQNFAKHFDAVDRLVGPAADTTLWTKLLDQVRAVVAPALERPVLSPIQEDYLIGSVQALDQPLSTTDLRNRVDLAGFLAGETRPLSDAATRDFLQRSFSYFADDLVVLTWDRAFIYEPRGDSDVADIIEVANAQLVELRYYDELLDDELPRMYDRVEDARRALSLFASRRFADLARKLYTLVAEVTELTEKVDNALQVTEDVYLSRVYSAALDLFRVPNVSAAVDRKLAIIRDTYAALYTEASSRRAELLEIAIVLLIVVEIVLAVTRR
jgi:hypothetical protein